MNLDLINISSNGWFQSQEYEPQYYPLGGNTEAFIEEQTAYDVESNLYRNIYAEHTRLHGAPCEYYITSYNTAHNKIFGEDTNRSIVRKFTFYCRFSLPEEREEFAASFMIVGVDDIMAYVSIQSFDEYSRYDTSAQNILYNSYVPKSGDYIRTVYNGQFLEVITVKKTKGQHLKRQHSYNIILRPMRDENLSVSATIPSDDSINFVNDIADLFNTSATIEEKKPDVIYNPPSTQTQNPFGSWT